MNDSTNSDFLKGTFEWFTGVIEDINDPLEMGRYRVRCFGFHTADKLQIPTESLPWAFTIMPVTSAAMSGIGTSATGLLQGSWVMGFFRDGKNAQDPIIMGSIPSMHGSNSDPTKGFSDPDGIYPRETSVVQEDPDLPKPSRQEYISSQPYISKEDNRQENVETATPPRVTSIAPDRDDVYYERYLWENRKIDEIISPLYPKNHVSESESGHIREVDDTAGAERISEYHRSGTYEEVVANGDKTVTVVGNEFEVTFKDKNMYVKGNVNLTVEGNMKTLVKGNYHLEVEGDKTEYIKGDRISKVGLNELTEIDEECAVNIAKNLTTRIGGDEIRDNIGNSTRNIAKNLSDTIVGNSLSTTIGNNDTTVIGAQSVGIGEELTMVSGGTLKIDTQSNLDIDAASMITMTTPAPIDIDGLTIDLN